MWEQYKRTFARMQTLIVLVTIVTMAMSRAWQVGMTFFLAMQVGSIAGAIWGARLKRLFFPEEPELPHRSL